MLSKEFLAELHRLNRAEKIRVVQLLVNELAAEEAILDPNVQYEVWSPYDSAQAVKHLREAMQKLEGSLSPEEIEQELARAKADRIPAHEAQSE